MEVRADAAEAKAARAEAELAVQLVAKVAAEREAEAAASDKLCAEMAIERAQRAEAEAAELRGRADRAGSAYALLFPAPQRPPRVRIAASESPKTLRVQTADA
eukprot:1371142-Prymnesium_polylepis.1